MIHKILVSCGCHIEDIDVFSCLRVCVFAYVLYAYDIPDHGTFTVAKSDPLFLDVVFVTRRLRILRTMYGIFIRTGCDDLLEIGASDIFMG